LSHTATFSLTHRDGYTAEAVLRRGQVAKASTVTDSLAPCPVKPDADAVVPFELRVINTTPDFSASPGVRLGLHGVGKAGDFWFTHGFRAVVRHSKGPNCVDLQPVGRDAVSLAPAQPLATSAFVQVRGWFIIEGYYSPAAPEGDLATIRDRRERPTCSWVDSDGCYRCRAEPSPSRDLGRAA